MVRLIGTDDMILFGLPGAEVILHPRLYRGMLHFGLAFDASVLQFSLL